MKKKIKNTSRIVTAIMITFLTGSMAVAQPGGGPPQAPSDKQIKKMVKELDKELDLSNKQNEQVSELYFAHADKVEAKLKSNQRPARSEMEALDSKLEKEVKSVLDTNQQKLYTVWLKKQEKQRSSQRPAAPGGQRPPR